MKHLTTKTKVARAAMTLLVALLGSVTGAWAEEELTVYDRTDFNGYLPIYGLFADSQGAASEFVIPSYMLTEMKDGTISELKFYVRTSAALAWTATIQVYLKEISGTTLTGITGPDASTVVYTGTLDATGPEMTVTFNTPYTYNGGNLLIGTYNSVEGNYSSAYFYGSTQSENNAWCRNYASITGTAQKFIPKTTFTYIQGGGTVCLKPTLTMGNITDNSATLTCSKGSETYNVQYKQASETTWKVVASNTSETSFTLTGLTKLTAYDVRVQSVCSDDATSDWRTASFTTTDEAEAVGSSWTDNFEGNSCEWSLINGSCTNAWVWGTAANNDNTKALYISNDGGNTHAYDAKSNTMVYATKLLSFTEGKYVFSYDWLAKGESTFDFLRVALVPGGKTITAGTSKPSGFSSSSLPTGWIALDGGSKLNLATDWQNKCVTINVAAGNYYLVLAWRNDDYTSYDPPAAINNVSISKVTCSAEVENLAVTGVTTNSATLTWKAVESQQWQVVYSANSSFEGATPTTVNAATCTISGLNPASHYSAKVRAYCGGSDYGEWSEVIQFNTDCDAITTYPWTENFHGFTVASTWSLSSRTLPPCWNYINECNNSSLKYYPTIYNSSSYANSTPNSLRFYSYYSSTVDYDPQPQYAILPQMNNLSGKYITLYAKGYNTSCAFKIGTMTNPLDANTFTPIATQTLTTSYEEYIYQIPTGTSANYVAIMMEAATADRTTNSVYIDDITIMASACPKPHNLSATTYVQTATISWECEASSLSPL